MPILVPADPRIYRARVALALILLFSACGRDGPGERARAAEIRLLAHQSFAQAAESGRCADDCARQEAGFAFAKAHAMTQDNDCIGKGDEDFVEGCRQYGEDIDQAYLKALDR